LVGEIDGVKEVRFTGKTIGKRENIHPFTTI
jgi:hypothetical protein